MVLLIDKALLAININFYKAEHKERYKQGPKNKYTWVINICLFNWLIIKNEWK